MDIRWMIHGIFHFINPWNAFFMDLPSIWRFPESQGYPKRYHPFIDIFSITNHPAMGVPLFTETSISISIRYTKENQKIEMDCDDYSLAWISTLDWFPARHGDTAVVFHVFMENPNLKWMRTGVFPHDETEIFWGKKGGRSQYGRACFFLLVNDVVQWEFQDPI